MVTLIDQLDQLKRSVSYDVYDISVRQLVDMVHGGIIDIAPDYQRHFVWDAKRESELIESILLGIPVPSLYMATNPDSSWEVVDGVQRLSTLIHFCGNSQQIAAIGKKSPLTLTGLEKLTEFNGLDFSTIPFSTQTYLTLRPLRITTLNDRSDVFVRYDLFERLNTGGVELHPQEIRNCVISGKLRDIIKQFAGNLDFRAVITLPKNEVEIATYEEMILRFFAFFDGYLSFDHDVGGFLTSYMQSNANTGPSSSAQAMFGPTMAELRKHLPSGVSRNNRRRTPINLYEGVAVGSALALKTGKPLKWEVLAPLLDSAEMKKFTTAATNSRPMVKGRIELVRDALLA
jgi:hypothetical protein